MSRFKILSYSNIIISIIAKPVPQTDRACACTAGQTTSQSPTRLLGQASPDTLLVGPGRALVCA